MNTRKLISFDWALKRLLCSKANCEILEGFLSELIKDDIKILELLFWRARANQDQAWDKSNRVDMKVCNRKQEIILIHVQYEREFDFLQRVLFSTTKTITEHLAKSERYEHVVKVMSINILYFRSGAWKRLYLSWQDPIPGNALSR